MRDVSKWSTINEIELCIAAMCLALFDRTSLREVERTRSRKFANDTDKARRII